MDVIYEGKVEKFSMGRTAGFRWRNWKTRHMRLTNSQLGVFDSEKCTSAKLLIPVSAISLVFTNPSKTEHPEASGGNMFIVRLFTNGVFDLLVKVASQEEKSAWIDAFNRSLRNVKGAQVV